MGIIIYGSALFPIPVHLLDSFHYCSLSCATSVPNTLVVLFFSLLFSLAVASPDNDNADILSMLFFFPRCVGFSPFSSVFFVRYETSLLYTQDTQQGGHRITGYLSPERRPLCQTPKPPRSNNKR